MKRLKWILVGLVAAVILTIVIVVFRLDSIVRRVVQTQSTASLGLKTELRSAHVSLLGGSLGLRDFVVSSPQGFKAANMLSLGGARVGVSVGALRGHPVTIDQVVLDKPRFVMEQAGGKFNFQALMDLKSSAPPDSSDPLKLIIKDLAVNDAEVVIRPGIPGVDNEITLPIPSFHVTDIGTADESKNGAAVREVVLLVLNDLASRAIDSGRLPADVQKLLSVNVEQFRQQVKSEVGKQIGKFAKDLTKNVPGDVGKNVDQAIEKGIGDLLNKQDKKPGQPGK